MKVLLDSNVWRYVADQEASGALRQAAAESGAELVVVPALIYEARNLEDISLRKRILRLLASPYWIRLMPEVLLEAEEIKNIVRRFRGEWLIGKPGLSEVNRLKWDWERPEDGFWSRAREDVAPPVTDESMRADREHQLAREESKAIRRRVFEEKQSLPSTLSLNAVYGVPPSDLPGWRGDPVEYWRVPSLYHFQTELNIYASPYREWLDSEIDVSAIQASPESLTRLWYYEISPQDLPRQWIRGAFEFLQGFHKVTPGSPVDSQLSAHLVDVDAVISADRNFIRFAQQCRTDAPFHVAQAHIVPGGPSAVASVLETLRNLAIQ